MARYERDILNIVNHSYDHLTAEEIFHKMKENGSKIALASVYNNLNRLVDKHCIQKLVIEGENERFDRVDKHDHLICQNCGAISDKKFSDLSEALSRQMDTELISYDLKVFYLCPECRKKLKK